MNEIFGLDDSLMSGLFASSRDASDIKKLMEKAIEKEGTKLLRGTSPKLTWNESMVHKVGSFGIFYNDYTERWEVAGYTDKFDDFEEAEIWAKARTSNTISWEDIERLAAGLPPIDPYCIIFRRPEYPFTSFGTFNMVGEVP